jgi:hypothetical protein
VEELDFAECIPTLNAERFGVNLNTELALADGFHRADFVIHIEDDVVCARDTLRYFEWCRQRFAEDLSVFSVTAYNRSAELPPHAAWHQVGVRHWFHPLACGTWKNRWEAFRGRLHSALGGWDAFLTWNFCAGKQPGGLVEVFPDLSRAQHIGLESSVSMHSADWYREHHRVRHWAGDHAVPDGEFHLGQCALAAMREMGCSATRPKPPHHAPSANESARLGPSLVLIGQIALQSPIC